MKKKLGALLLLSVFSIVSCDKEKDSEGSGCDGINVIHSDKTNTIDSLYVVKFKDGLQAFQQPLKTKYFEKIQAMQSALKTWAEARDFKEPLYFRAVFTSVFKGFEAKLTAGQLAIMKADPTVDRVEPVVKMAIAQCTSTPFGNPGSQLVSYGVKRIGSGNGVGKRVWILDTGVDVDHPDLTLNIGMSRDFTNGAVGGRGGAAYVDDKHGHGTHVSGIVAAKNNSFGTLGVAYGAEVVALKVLDQVGEGNSSTLMQALDYLLLVGLNGEVANISLGGAASALVDLSVQQVGLKGILVSMAAGNDRKSATETSPARANGANLFTVSAIDNKDVLASFSNYGNPPIDFAEPGVSIASTYKGGIYAYFSGTSMAAPHLAGLLLLEGTDIKSGGTAKGDNDGSPDVIGVR